MIRPLLPIDEGLPQIRAAVGQGRPVVLKASPGAGKTTGVPQALLDDEALTSSVLAGKQIWVIQPRRLAARSVAEFLSQSRDEAIGETIGYHVRLDRQESASTRVLLMTTKCFTETGCILCLEIRMSLVTGCVSEGF